MKMRKLISAIFLAMYSIVIVHSFLPHHHHSEFAQNTQQCEHNNHSHHQEEIEGVYSGHHSNHEHTSSYCSFNEITILKKSIRLSNLFISYAEIEFIGLKTNDEAIPDCYIPIQIPDPYCWDILLRGPPNFS